MIKKKKLLRQLVLTTEVANEVTPWWCGSNYISAGVTGVWSLNLKAMSLDGKARVLNIAHILYI